MNLSSRTYSFRTWHWISIPLLAITAYITVLRVGFLLDDFGLLRDARDSGINLQVLLPKPVLPEQFYFYRPVGTLLTWQIGWQLWGLNAFPYHVESLLIHAVNALLVGMWLAAATGDQATGWLAGALFGVFPLHLEAVAWLAAQWDELAVLFGLVSLVAFTKWWLSEGTRNVSTYVISLSAYALAIFTKESMFSFIAIIAAVPWFVGSHSRAIKVKRWTLAIIPFAAMLGVVLGIRLLPWGNIGGYPRAATDPTTFVWDHLIKYGQALVAPINPALLGTATFQIVGATVSLILLTALILYGRSQRRLLFIAGSWVIISLIPVLNLRISQVDLHNNRYMYLPAIGYCIGVAALITAAIKHARRFRVATLTGSACLIATCIALTWIQLLPWHTATVASNRVEQDLLTMVPPQPSNPPTTWLVENLPVSYAGAHALGAFLGYPRTFIGGAGPTIVQATDVANPLNSMITSTAEAGNDVFALRFNTPDKNPNFSLSYLAGITGRSTLPSSPPSGNQTGGNPISWDFTLCSRDVLGAWTFDKNNDSSCYAGTGLRIAGGRDNRTQIAISGLHYEVQRGSPLMDRFVRIRAEIKYSDNSRANDFLNWSWATPGESFTPAHSQVLPVIMDGQYHTYWAFVSVTALTNTITELRLETSNSDSIDSTLEIAWIQIDTVP